MWIEEKGDLSTECKGWGTALLHALETSDGQGHGPIRLHAAAGLAVVDLDFVLGLIGVALEGTQRAIYRCLDGGDVAVVDGVVDTLVAGLTVNK